jgi:type IV secretory pathway protease TraF
MAAGACAAMMVGWFCDFGPGRTWELRLNLTDSLAPGFYVCQQLPEEEGVERGALVAFLPPEPALIDLMRVAPHLHVHLMLKQMTALAPDTVCLQGHDVIVNGTVIAQCPLLEAYPLHAAEGCHALGEDEVFLMGTHARSYDSRYFSSVPRPNLAATCTALWTWETPL